MRRGRRSHRTCSTLQGDGQRRPAPATHGPAPLRGRRFGGLLRARRLRRQGRGRRLDARRVPRRDPEVRRDARELGAHGRPARARLDHARADAAPEARPDEQDPGRGRPRAAAVPGGRGPRQAAAPRCCRTSWTARRSSTTSSTTRRVRGRTSASSPGWWTRPPSCRSRRSAIRPTRRTRARCGRSAGRNRSTSCTAATSCSR